MAPKKTNTKKMTTEAGAPSSSSRKIPSKTIKKTRKALKDSKQTSSKELAKDYRFVMGEDGQFLFISDDFKALTKADLSCKASDVLHFADDDDAFDDRMVLTVGLFGADSHSDHSEASEQTDQHQDLWACAIKPGCHTMILGDNALRVDMQCDWMTAHNGKQYLVASGPASPNIPQNEDKMQKLVFQILNQKAHKTYEESHKEFSRQQDISADYVSERYSKKTPPSARLRFEEIGHFMDMSDDLMCTAHLDGSLIRFSASFEAVLGYRPEQLIGKSFMDFIHESDRALVRNAFYGLTFDHEAPHHNIDFEARMTKDNGEACWVHWQIRKYQQCFYALGRDITSNKSHQTTLDRRQQQLLEAQALAKMGHWRWEVGSDMIEWSDQLYDVFGVTKDNFTTTLDNINALIHRRDIGRLYQAFQRAIIQQHDYDMDFRIHHTDGTDRFIRCEGRCELDHEGDVIALYGIMQDVTSQMEYEHSLRLAKEAAESAYAAKSRFLANMSHELRTPLNAIIGFSEMIEHQLLGPIGNPKYLDYIGGIRESGSHLLDLISDILDMSKIEAGKYELDLEEVNVDKLIRLALHMMEGRASECGVSLNVSDSCAGDDSKTTEDSKPSTANSEAPSKPSSFGVPSHEDESDIKITADRRALMQILLNLLSNAVKFTERGGKVSACCARADEQTIVITVSDTGVGIPMHKLASVLNPFEQAAHEHTRDHEGSGLGLSITKELVELHGGVLGLDSTLGKGTKVTITLPVSPRSIL
jgi:two-component system cell cycle sensor histidine kinase PleC